MENLHNFYTIYFGCVGLVIALELVVALVLVLIICNSRSFSFTCTCSPTIQCCNGHPAQNAANTFDNHQGFIPLTTISDEKN